MTQKILFYGNSVVLGALAASLRDVPEFQVTILVPPWPGKKRLAEMKPDIIFFDLEAYHPEASFSLLERCPGLLLIGISPDNNLMKMWSGQQLRELSTEDLLGVINKQLKNTSAL